VEPPQAGHNLAQEFIPVAEESGMIRAHRRLGVAVGLSPECQVATGRLPEVKGGRETSRPSSSPGPISSKPWPRH